MNEFPVRMADQLPSLLQSFRKAAGLTQADVAARLGVTQQTLSALERNASNVGAARLMKLLSILDVELVLRQRRPSGVAAPRAGGAPGEPDKVQW
ncbi:XRE family transcriptional regulator [Methylibium sp. Pch-M]|jgi:HTH-type transcriptional regulator/antitoxin HipB|uniref:helix-turn-helix transcriptional regulator n=1 Tax=Methylibium sp. Pch-M TaxID=2082386 RepID=UPI001010934F|nr:helix-turn-helix transcriptional regulator [Methylibium sp. Pch-M]QAZ39109.1 XRE family transcriptional regulator [Methylibium sp. Pch-M]